MAAFDTETVTWVHHWDERVFSFRTTRESSLRFENGQFVMIGLEIDGKPIMRAYSIASPNYAEFLEFLSIKVQNGPLTSRLQHLKVGDKVIMSRKPTGTLVLRDLKPGKVLYMLSTGTGLAPFMSLVADPEVYEAFETVVLVHGVRNISELAYHQYLSEDIKNHEFLGEDIREKLIYYPTVTREPFKYTGRIPDLFNSGKLEADIGLHRLNPETDRVMICGSVAMLNSLSQMLNARGFKISPRSGEQGDYVIERAFVPT
jgi:ferredoxin--NADP+ reductase